MDLNSVFLSENTNNLQNALWNYVLNGDETPCFIVNRISLTLAGYNKAFAEMLGGELPLYSGLSTFINGRSYKNIEEICGNSYPSGEVVLTFSGKSDTFDQVFIYSQSERFQVFRGDYKNYVQGMTNRYRARLEEISNFYIRVREALELGESTISWELDDQLNIVSVGETGLFANLAFLTQEVKHQQILKYIDQESQALFLRTIHEFGDKQQKFSQLSINLIAKDGKLVSTQSLLQRLPERNVKAKWLLISSCLSPSFQKILEETMQKVVSEIAHDVKQPANVITNTISIMKENLEEIRDLKKKTTDLEKSLISQGGEKDHFAISYVRLKDNLNLISKEIKKFNELVIDYLLYENCRLRSDYLKTFPKEAFNPQVAAESTIHNIQLTEDLVYIESEIEKGSTYLYGPKNLIFGNILSLFIRSSVEYVLRTTVDPKIKVKLEILSQDEKEKEMVFEISDNGPTLDNVSRYVEIPSEPNEHTSLFTTSRGIGIGLFLANIVTREYQGVFEVFEDLEKGTTFKLSFRLPIHKPEVLPKAVAPAGKLEVDPALRKKQRMRFLFADDVFAQRRIVEAMFKKEGVDYQLASDGTDVIRLVVEQKQMFDVILIDYSMNQLNGPETVQALRKFGYTGLIIGLTGISSMADEENFRRAGVDIIKHKPIDIRLLVESLQGERGRI